MAEKKKTRVGTSPELSKALDTLLKPRDRNTKVINIPAEVHDKLVAHCNSSGLLKGAFAARAISEAIQRGGGV